MAYRLFLFLHRWSGIIAAALIVVIGVTGSVLVFRDSLDRSLNAEMLEVAPGPQRLAPDEIVARVQASFQDAQVTALLPYEDPTRAWTVFLGRRMVYVNPYTGDITGTRTRGEGGFDRRGFVPLMHGLHHDLLLEAPGHWLVAGTGLVWMVLSLAGIYLSIKQAGGFGAAFGVRADVNLKRLFVDLHRSVGLVTVVFAVALSITGIYLGVRQPATQLVSVFSQVTPPPERVLPDAPVDRPVGFGSAIAAATAAIPGASVQSVFAVRAKGLYRVRVTKPVERFVYVSMQDAAVVKVRDPRQGTAGDVFVAWQKPIHTGQAFGAAGEAVAFLMGLLPLGFAITGIYLWLARRRSRTKRTRQQPSGSQPSAISNL